MAHLYGTGQRELFYVYDLNGNNARETVKLADNATILSQSITTDFGQVVAQAQPNANGGFIYNRSEYNALGQLTKQYQDTGWNTAKTAASLYEYDAFGNVVKQTLALTSSSTPLNSPVTEMAYGAEELTDGIYHTVTRTRYNAEGNPLVSVQKSLVSNLSDTLESKNLTIDERNLTSTQWVEYHDGTKRKSYNSLPTSDITAEAVSVDGFALSQTDNAGVTTATGRSYTANGMIQTRTDGRGNTTTTVTDIAGRTLTVTDAAGNVTTTGIWSITYDAENRPVSFINAESNTVLECAYDHMGRRATKKVTIDGEVTLHQRYLYRGYLQIACCDLTRSNHPALWLITWDPTQPIATRPLAIQKDGTWYTYGWDLTKNICELYGSNGYIRTAYTYTPYGEVTESANSVYQPIQWSSEYNDTELGMVYYNYRHYNPMDGRWIGRDKELYNNLYEYVKNEIIKQIDFLGLKYTLNKQAPIEYVQYIEGGFLGKFYQPKMQGVEFPNRFCFYIVDVPDIDLTGTIFLVSNDEKYNTELQNMQYYYKNENLNLKDAKKRTRKHERQHFKDYYSRMINYVDLANSYDGEWLSTSSADKIKRYLDAFMKLTLAQIKVDGFNLDIKDYFGKEKETRMQDGPALMAALHTAQNEFINAWIDVVITKCD